MYLSPKSFWCQLPWQDRSKKDFYRMRGKRRKQNKNKHRKHVLEELEELKKLKKRIKLDIDSLTKSADDFCEKAELTGNLTHVTKSNAFRRTAKDKNIQLQEVEEKLNRKLQVLKEC